MELFRKLFGDLSDLRLSLLRPHRHPRLLERSVTAWTSCAFLPPGRRCSGGEQGGVASAAHYRNGSRPLRNHTIPI